MWTPGTVLVGLATALLWLAAAPAAAADAQTPLGDASDTSLLWGPFRSNLYFGMRPQIPHSLLTGLMWYNANDMTGVYQLRHAPATGDSVAGFGWTQYDARLGGVEYVRDTGNRLNLTIELVKGADGLSWTARVRGEQPADGVQALIFSAGLEGAGQLDLASRLTREGIVGDAVLHGATPELGKYTLRITEGRGSRPASAHPAAAAHPPQKAQYARLNIPDDNVWQAKDIFLTLAQDQLGAIISKYQEEGDEALAGVPPWAAVTLGNDDSFQGRFHLVQKVFQGPFEFEIVFTPKHAAKPVTVDNFDERLAAVLAAQDAKFSEVFQAQPPFDTPAHRAFARELVSSVVGGIGYFYGDSLIGDPDDRSVVETAPARSLLTCTPTRSFFPRGFYWDEGFHLLALVDYDLDLLLDIVTSWLGLMDEDGWIGREQILGPEARSRVPEEFQVQYPDYANPPTLVMLLAYLGSVKQDPSATAKLADVYPALVRHFNWFRRTQRGELLEFDREPPSAREAYRWRGRTPTHVLTSGMDDYPRAEEPSDGELHVDLLAWVGVMARSLKQIAEVVDKPEDAVKYGKIEENVKDNLVALHWNAQARSFCDLTINEFEEDEHVCHIGYVTLLPFMLRLVREDDAAKLDATLEILRDADGVWSPFGIRSLSQADPYFGQGEDYWRGPIWLNMNYLLLDALKYYAENAKNAGVRQHAADIYKELRVNVVSNVYKVWQETGFLWEQYNSLDGARKGANAFSGWTALVANIIAMPETPSNHVGKSSGAASASREAAPKQAAVVDEDEDEDEDEDFHEEL